MVFTQLLQLSNVMLRISNGKPAYAFITMGDTRWRNLKARAKYTLMRLQRVVYPDAYFIPAWLGGRVKFIPLGKRTNPDRYARLFSELHAGIRQLEHPLALMERDPWKMILIIGPPEIFKSYASPEAWELARRLLQEAGQVWAYCQQAADFANELAGGAVARVIPWPFDYETTHRIGFGSPGSNDRRLIKVLIGVPLQFVGIAANEPAFLEDCLAAALTALPIGDRERFQFFGMVYTKDDALAWRQSGFGKKIGVTLEPKKLYTTFLRFVGDCDAVITLPRFSVLGRIAFVAAALDKPGIFTANVELHRRLYPHSLVASSIDPSLKESVRDLLSGLACGQPPARFLPDAAAAREVGDLTNNGALLRRLLN